MNLRRLLSWPLRRSALRLYRPYIEFTDGVAAASVNAPVKEHDWAPVAAASTIGHRSRALGRLIQEYREFAGYSRVRLGDLVGIPPGELERWEVDGVSLPAPERVLSIAEFLDVPTAAVEAAIAEDDEAAAQHLPPHDFEDYGAVPALESAVKFHGWTADEVAEALHTSPTRVQAWRLGAIEMTAAERTALLALVRLKSERAAE
jgi:transcriptional regulator with XRE-family HTH domain